MIDAVAELTKYLMFASVSTDPDYNEGMKGARDFVVGHLETLGFSVELVKTPLHPIILASRKSKPQHPHILIYAHYDVQPADPFELWTSPPFDPRIEDNMIYARGACDNKGPFICQIAGLAQLLEKHSDLPLNITFLIEGEEEMGSPSFPAFLEKYKDRLKEADFLLISDSCSPNRNQVTITTALRGLVDLEVEVAGPNIDLHSGLHGGTVYNPIQALTEICASLHTQEGRVNIDGFYDDVLPAEDWERDELKKYPLNDEEYKEFLGIPVFHCPKDLAPLEAPRFSPTLEFNGIGGGYQGKGSKTIIPSKAFVKITCRLVSNQNPEKVRKIVVKALEERCPKGVSIKIHQRDGGYPYLIVPPHKSKKVSEASTLAKAFKVSEAAIKEIYGTKPLFLREGGSIPIISQIHHKTGLDCLMIGLALNTDKMHAPNETFDLEMMKKGIKIYEKILAQIAKVVI